MANKADNFAANMKITWDGKRKTNQSEENALLVAKRQDAVVIAEVVSDDHWINEPGDEPGFLMEWPDGSQYIVGQNGHWIHSCRGRGRQKLRYRVLA